MPPVVSSPRRTRRRARPATLDLRPEGPLLEVLGELGQGGMGTVLRVREVATGRVLALKQLLSTRVSARALRRFLRECHISGSLRHGGIVRVHSAGSKRGRPWLLTEMVEGGRTLRTIFEDAETTRTQRTRLLLEVARAVGFAHSRGVIHRDLKPDNVLVNPEGHARLTDFGLAKAEDGDRLTRTGSMVGTPHYMAPEQITGDQARQGPASDVWALGVMLYQALSGQLPFLCDNLSALSARICKVHPPALSSFSPEISPALIAVVECAMQKQPERRYANGEAFADALEHALRNPQAVTPPPRWLLPLMASLAACGMVALVVCLLTSGVATPASVALAFDPTGGQTTGSSLEVRGSAPAEAGWVEVRVSADVRRVPLRNGQFVCRGLPLEPGLNSVSARVLPHGAPVLLEVERLTAPAWYEQQRNRPPFPLPPGVVFGDTPGDYLNVEDGSLLRWVAPGSYAIGKADTLVPHSAPRNVSLQAGYFVGKHEVTWAQFDRFCEATGHRRPKSVLSDSKNGMGSLDPMTRNGPPFEAGDTHPVFHVSYADALAYCEWAGVRLPSGPEWEVAARGTGSFRFPWGNRARRHHANTETENDGHFYPSPVGSFPSGASQVGCLDMAGNVSEWTTDLYPGTERRVVRGGSWNVAFDYCETTLLEPQIPTSRPRSVGFRVVKGLDASL